MQISLSMNDAIKMLSLNVRQETERMKKYVFVQQKMMMKRRRRQLPQIKKKEKSNRSLN